MQIKKRLLNTMLIILGVIFLCTSTIALILLNCNYQARATEGVDEDEEIVDVWNGSSLFTEDEKAINKIIKWENNYDEETGNFINNGSPEKPYEICDLNQLMAFVYLVNDDDCNEEYASKSYKLTSDITIYRYKDSNGDGEISSNEYFNDLSNDNIATVSWVPIGINTDLTFKGTFDGNNHSIKNVLLNTDKYMFLGIFGVIEGATIKNLNVERCLVTDGTANKANTYSALVGYTVYNETETDSVPAIIQNCTVSGKIDVTPQSSNTKPNQIFGSVVGEAEGVVQIDGCVSNVNILVQNSFEDCEGLVYLGGIAGCLWSAYSTITNCVNNGSIEFYNKGYANGYEENDTNTYWVIDSGTGGICGYACFSAIYNCINTGTLIGYSGIGGIIYMSDCSKVINCVNQGVIQVDNYADESGFNDDKSVNYDKYYGEENITELYVGQISAFVFAYYYNGQYYGQVINCVAYGTISINTENALSNNYKVGSLYGSIVYVNEEEDSYSPFISNNYYNLDSYVFGENDETTLTISVVGDSNYVPGKKIVDDSENEDNSQIKRGDLVGSLNTWVETNLSTYGDLKSWISVSYAGVVQVPDILVSGMSYDMLNKTSSVPGYQVSWFTDSSMETPFDFSTALTENVTLYGGNKVLLAPDSIAIKKTDGTNVLPTGNTVNLTYDDYSVVLTATPSHKSSGVTFVYQWYHDDTVLDNFTEETITISNVNESGKYYVEVKAYDGEICSEIKKSEDSIIKISPKEIEKPEDNDLKSYTYNAKTQTLAFNESYSGIDYVEFTADSDTQKKDYSADGYTANVTLKDKDNYVWGDGTTTDVSLNWNIKKINSTITASTQTHNYSTPDGGTYNPNGETFALVVDSATCLDGLPVTLTYCYRVGNSGAYSSYSSTIPSFVDAGSYQIKIKATVEGSPNYSDTYKDVTLTINKLNYSDAGCEVVAYSGEYDGNAHTISISNLPENTTVNYSLNNSNFKDAIYSFTDVCDKTIYVKLTNKNFNDSVIRSSVKITSREISVFANHDEKEYDGIVLNPQLTVLNNRLCEGHTLQFSAPVNLTEVGNLEYTATDLVIKDASGKNVTANYSITENLNGSIKINPRTITYTIRPSESQFGDADVQLSGYVSQGTLAGQDPSITLTREQGGVIGVYKIIGSWTNNNYNVIFQGENSDNDYGTYTITQRRVTVKINKVIAFKGYQEMPLGYKISEGTVLEDDNLNIVLTRESGNALGEYLISGTYDNSNYAVTFINDNYQIVDGIIQDYIIARTHQFSYDGQEHTAEVQLKEGFDNAIITYSSSGSGEYTSDLIYHTEKGRYKIYYKVQYGDMNEAYGYMTLVIGNGSASGCGTVAFTNNNSTGLLVGVALPIIATLTLVLFRRKREN